MQHLISIITRIRLGNLPSASFSAGQNMTRLISVLWRETENYQFSQLVVKKV